MYFHGDRAPLVPRCVSPWRVSDHFRNKIIDIIIQYPHLKPPFTFDQAARLERFAQHCQAIDHPAALLMRSLSTHLFYPDYRGYAEEFLKSFYHRLFSQELSALELAFVLHSQDFCLNAPFYRTSTKPNKEFVFDWNNESIVSEYLNKILNQGNIDMLRIMMPKMELETIPHDLYNYVEDYVKIKSDGIVIELYKLLAPQVWYARLALGEIYYQQENYNEAITWLTHAATSPSDMREELIYVPEKFLSDVYESLNDLAQAKMWRKKAEETIMADEEDWEMLIGEKVDLKNYTMPYLTK